MQAEALLEHAGFIRALAESLTFGSEDPDDLVQQLWLVAIEHPPQSGPGIKGWLATVLRNALRQNRRSEGRRGVREALANDPRPVPTPAEIREREAVRQEVVEAVLDLEEPYRSVILLRYYEDLPPREIAARTGDPVETVKTRLVRARGRLRASLDDRHGGDGKRWGLAVAGLAFRPEKSVAAAATGIPFLGLVAGVVGVVGVAVVVALAVSFASPSLDGEPDSILAAVTTGDEPAPPAGTGKSADDGSGPGKAPVAQEPGAAEEGAGIVGRIVDESTGKPVPGATAHLVLDSSPPQALYAITDEEGRFRFEDLTTGVKARVFVKTKGQIGSAGGIGVNRVLEEGEVATCELKSRYRPGKDLRIHLRLPEGVPAPKELRVTGTSETPKTQYVWLDDVAVDAGSLVMTIFLGVGHHRLGFESPKLKGELPPIEVTGDTAPEDVTLDLVLRRGFRLRLVDADGLPLIGAPVRIQVLMEVVSRDSMGNANWTMESLGEHQSDDRGELDLTGILPALNQEAMMGNAFAFAFGVEGVFAGTLITPNFKITVEELLELRERQVGIVVIDAPALPFLPLETTLRNPAGKPMEGVVVVGVPPEYFAEDEYLSDSDGKIRIRLVKGTPFGRGKPEESPRLVAQKPYIGEVGVSSLGREAVPGGPPGGFVVWRSAEVSLKLVDEEGLPIASTDVTLGRIKAKTDEAGVVRVTIPEGTPKVWMRVPNHFMVTVDLQWDGEVQTVKLRRGREVRVRCIMPDGTAVSLFLVGRVDGDDTEYRPARWDQEKKEVVMLLPAGRATIMVDPRTQGVTGEVEVGPGDKEVELRVERK